MLLLLGLASTMFLSDRSAAVISFIAMHGVGRRLPLL